MDKKALTVVDKPSLWRRPLSATLGRLSSLPMIPLLGTTAPLKRTASKENMAKTLAALSKVDPTKDKVKSDQLEVQLGAGNLLRSLKRVWQRKNLSLPGKLLGTAVTPLWWAQNGISRADRYNPFSNVATVYNQDPAILAHEVGHGADFNNQKFKTLYAMGRSIWPVLLAQEAAASENAMQLMRQGGMDEAARERAQRVLSGALGTYVGSTVLPGLGTAAGGILGQGAGMALKPFDAEHRQTEKAKTKEEKKKQKAKEKEQAKKAALYLLVTS